MRLSQLSGKRRKKRANMRTDIKHWRLRYRVDKQQQLEGRCMELKAANSKWNSRQLFIWKFQPRLQCIQSATGENLTEAAQIADRWKGYCEDLYHDEEGKRTEQEYWEQEPPPFRSEVARAIRQTASRKAVKAGHSARMKKHVLTPLKWKGWERFCGFRGQQRKQMSGFLTKLE